MTLPNTNVPEKTFKTGIRLENNVKAKYSFASHFLLALAASILLQRYGWTFSLFFLGFVYVYLSRSGRWVLEVNQKNGSVTRYFQSIFRLENETVNADEFDVVAIRRKLRLSSRKGQTEAYFYVIYLEQESGEENRKFECQPLMNYQQSRSIAVELASCFGMDLVDHTTIQADRLRSDEVGKPLVRLLKDRQELELPTAPETMRSVVEHGDGRTTITIPPVGFGGRHMLAKASPGLFLASLLSLGMFLSAIKGDVDGFGYVIAFLIGIIVWTLSFLWYPHAYKEEQVEIADGILTIRTKLFGDKKTQFHTSIIVNVVGRIEARTPSLPGVTVMSRDAEATFGSELSDEEQKYLCGLVRAAIVLNSPNEEILVAELIPPGMSADFVAYPAHVQ